MAKPIYRSCSFDRSKIDKEKRTVPVVFSTETPVDRGAYDEVLDHGAADLGRLRSSAPVLLNHDPDQQIGVVDEADIDDGDDSDRSKKGRAVMRFGNSAKAAEIFQDVQDGIRTGVSVGYDRTQAISRTKGANGRDAIRFAWAPFELSIVSIPADINAMVGRSHPIENDPIPSDPMKRSLLFDAAPADGNGSATRAATTAVEIDREKIGSDAVSADRIRAKNVRAAAEALARHFPTHLQKFRELAEDAVYKGTSAADFNAGLLAEIPCIQVAKRDVALIGMSHREINRYSMLRGIQRMIEQKPLDGLELECHQEMEKRSAGLDIGSGSHMLVPADIEVDLGSARRGRRMAMTRDLNVTTASQGGDFVQTSIVTPIIEILRNRMVTEELGIQTMSGLQGNIALPRQTGAATVYSLAESALLTLSTQAINQVALSPHRVGAYNQYTKQLLLQTSVDVDNFVRNDLMRVLAIKIDSLVMFGQGSASEPTGIFNTTGIGAVTFGATATWAKVIAFETALATGNADIGRMAYVVDPATRGAWKNIAKIGTTFPIFLWEGADYGEGTRSLNGEVNGYRACATNQMQQSRCLFGNFEDDILAMWGGFDVVVNPYTLDTSAEVRITVNTFIDNAVRHAVSFCASTDSANQ